jgi:hypothetical protein
MSANEDLDKCCFLGSKMRAQNSLSNNANETNNRSVVIKRTNSIENRYQVSIDYELKFIESEMNPQMKDFTISTITQLIQSLEAIEMIPQNLTKSFDDCYGKHWNCFLFENFVKQSVNYITGTYVKIEINKLSLILFQTPNQSQNEVIINDKKS